MPNGEVYRHEPISNDGTEIIIITGDWAQSIYDDLTTCGNKETSLKEKREPEARIRRELDSIQLNQYVRLSGLTDNDTFVLEPVEGYEVAYSFGQKSNKDGSEEMLLFFTVRNTAIPQAELLT